MFLGDKQVLEKSQGKAVKALDMSQVWTALNALKHPGRYWGGETGPEMTFHNCHFDSSRRVAWGNGG